MPLKRMKAAADNTKNADNLVSNLSEDLLDQVFKFLPIKSLCRTAQVCKLWHEVAQREMSKRSIHHVLIDTVFHDSKQFISQFQAKPNTSLYFCASRPHLRNADNIEYATLYGYNANYPCMGRMLMLGVEHAMLDNTEIKSCHEVDPVTKEHYPPNGVLGINLANSKDLRVKVAWCESCEERSLQLAQTVLNKLQPSSDKGNPVYLMFGAKASSVYSRVLASMRQKYADSQPNVWGGTMSHFIKCNDSYPDWRGTHGFLGILLQRPRLSSHSTIVSVSDNLSERLTEFRARLRLRRRSLGLVCGPHSKGQVFIYKLVMEAVKSQFPTVPFAAFFNSPLLHYYGCDNASTDAGQELMHKEALSIMILTYD